MKYDVYNIGNFSLDSESLMGGPRRVYIGGGLLFSAYAEVNSGRRVGALTRIADEHRYYMDPFIVRDLTMLPSKASTSAHCDYLSEDKERRDVLINSLADPITPADIPDVEAEVFQMAGLYYGEFDDALFAFLAQKGKVASDMQCYTRYVEDGRIVYRDWADKKTYLPYITYLKTDAREAELMTGTEDRREAAKILHGWGAKEVVITHNTEVLVYDGRDYAVVPLRPRNLSGRSGRGDTTFGSYITERIDRDMPGALLYAAALVSLKMESPGPFKGRREDVLDYIAEFYPEYAL